MSITHTGWFSFQDPFSFAPTKRLPILYGNSNDFREAPVAVGSVWEAKAINIVSLIWNHGGDKLPGAYAGLLRSS